MKHLILALSFFSTLTVHATIWPVGPTRLYTVPSAVSSLVADGDTVEIDAGLYTGNVTKWFANNLVIRSVGGGYAHLEANGNYAEGKAIWVIKGANCIVEGIEFSGCKVPDHNGAGIRQEGKDLTLRNCYFHHNEMGILTSNDGVSDFVFEACEFAFNGFGDGYSHNIYVGSVNSLTMRNCYSHDAHVGHLVKSRARFNYLYYNRLTGESGDGSYEVDMPNGGQAILIGNLIEQSANSQNSGIISFALENQNHPEQQIVLSHNTIVNTKNSGRFIQFSNATTLVKLVNNLFLGGGTLLQGTTAVTDTVSNLRIPNIAAAQLIDPANYNYWPGPNAPCVNAGTNPGVYNNVSLVANFAYLHPRALLPRWYSGAGPDIGAYEFLTSPYRFIETEIKDNTFSIAPNPLNVNQTLTIEMAEPLSRETIAQVWTMGGHLIWKLPLPRGTQSISCPLTGLPAGTYLIQIAGHGVQRFVVL